MARNSTYGLLLNSLKIPGWVFGNDYGDLSNTLEKRDQEIEDTQTKSMLNEANQLRLDAAKREADFSASLSDIFKDNPQPTLRDLYQAQIQKAIETKNADKAVKLQEDLLKYDELEKSKKNDAFVKAATLADNLSPDVLASQYPDFPRSESERIFNERRKKKGSGDGEGPKKEKTYRMYNPETKDYVPDVPRSKYDQAKEAGYMDVSNPNFDDALEANDNARRRADKTKGGGLVDALTPWKGSVSSSSAPRPGDEVRVITRRRAGELKGVK